VKLTEEGRRVLRTAEPLAKRVDQRILDALPSKQRDQFMNDLASVISTLEPLPRDDEPRPRERPGAVVSTCARSS